MKYQALREISLRFAAMLALLLMLMATACAQDTTAAADSAAGADVQYDDQGNTPLHILVTTEQAIQLVKDQLHADADWTVEVVELNEENGIPMYTVVATDTLGDAHCRLVNAETGEMTTVNLWLDAQTDEEGGKDGKGEDGKSKKDGKDGGDENSGSDSEQDGDRRSETAQDGENQGENGAASGAAGTDAQAGAPASQGQNEAK